MDQQSPVRAQTNLVSSENFPYHHQQQWNQPALYQPIPGNLPPPPSSQSITSSQLAENHQMNRMNQSYFNNQPPPPSFKLPESNNSAGDEMNNQMSNLSLNNDPKNDLKSNLNEQPAQYPNYSNFPNNSVRPFANQNQNFNSMANQPPLSNPGVNYGYNSPTSLPPPPPPASTATGQQNNWNQNVRPNQPAAGYNNYQSVYDQQNNYPYNSYQAPPPPINQYTSNQASFNNNRYATGPSGPNVGYGSGQFGGSSPQQQNKLDPEAMPSVVQVILEDKAKYESNNNILFMTTIPASVPPLITTINQYENQIIQDCGCASPNFVRPTLYQLPVSEDNLKTSDIPFGIVIKPFDDQEVDKKICVPVTLSEIVRCNRCKAYMNPYNRFIDGGRRFQCSLCHHVTEVPPTYFSNLDHTGQRLDKLQRPELYLGSYEFLATEEYCRNHTENNRRPHLIFACELTETSKPILQILSKNLVNIIKNFPRDPLNPDSPPPMFGFLTYNSKIQVYDILNNGHCYVICDLSMPFAPLNTFLVDPLIHMDKIETFLTNLPQLYANEEFDMQTILGPVIETALMTSQSDVNNWINKNIVNKIIVDDQQNQTYETIPTGKIYLFHCTLPTYGSDADTPGRLKQKWTNSMEEMRKLLGSDREKTILSADKYYVQLGQKCVTDYATGVELFLFPPANGSFLDIATLGELTRLTGTGSIFKFYNDFSDNFLTDLKYSLYSSFAFECVLKVRTSTGIRPTDYVGYFYSRSPNDIECAAINTNTNFAVEFKYDDKLSEDEHIVIQAAILYTALSGQRRVRIHNIALASCQQIGDIYRNVCCDTVVNLIARNAIHHLRNGEKTIQQTKEAIVNRVINILTSYRKHCAQPGTSLGQLILPEAMKVLPMYICGLLKCDAIDGGPEMNPDDKAYAQLKLLGSYTSLSQVFLYPNLFKIEYESESDDSLKYSQIRCSSYKLSSSALAYVLENGFYILFYLTNNGCNNTKFLNGLFGPSVDSASKIQMDMPLPNLMTTESQFMHRFFKKMENERRCSYKVFIIRQGIDKTEAVFRSFLYEDQKIITRNAGDSKFEGLSYVDLLCHLHKEIRAQMN